MKRFTLRLLTVLGLSLVAYALAQDTTTPPADAAGASAAQGGMSGGMERMNRQGAMGEHPGTEYQGPEYQGMMPMMQMMNACASMMQHMTQMMSGAQAGAVGMTAGQMDMGQMNASGAARLDPTAAAAIARAFLTGRAPEGAASNKSGERPEITALMPRTCWSDASTATASASRQW